MRRSCTALIVLGALLQAAAAVVAADAPKDEAIAKERKRFQGTWRIVSLVVDGNKSTDEDARKFVVVNRSDGTWTLLSDDQEILKGRSLVDPTKTPKTVDILVTKEDGEERYLGIYEIGENARRLCFAPPGKERPTEFSSEPSSRHILVTFRRERVKPEANAGAITPTD
jgi:uncharacterized protein (TIGR03067 family)